MSLITETPLLTRAEVWRELGQQLRVDAIRATAVTKSGLWVPKTRFHALASWEADAVG